MSWKNVKDHYRIGHIVCIVPEKGICIGSPYIHDLIVVGLDGVVKKRYEGSGNEDLPRYQREMDADPALLAQLVATPDTFKCAKPVWTYDGGEVVLDHCEEYGWPNVSHRGRLMYENTFFTDKSKAVADAKDNARAGVKWRRECMAERQAEHDKIMAEIKVRGDRCAANLAKLNADYPEVTV